MMKIFLVLVVCCNCMVVLAHADRSLNLAVVQIESRHGDIEGNLQIAANWVEQAVTAGAEFILFPEFMSTGYYLSEAIWQSGETMDGPTVNWLKTVSERHRVWLGTSFLEVDGEHFYNTFVLSDPTGAVAGTVRKEVPAGAEGYFFLGDDNDHYIDTEIGRIGVMICYENYLSRIANKVAAANVNLLLMPFSFPRVLGGDVQPRSGADYAGFYSRQWQIPVAAVNQVGIWHSPIPGMQDFHLTGHFPGLSAIANAEGEVIAEADDQPGFAMAKVLMSSSQRNLKQFNTAYVPGLVDNVGSAKVLDTGRSIEDAQAAESYWHNEHRKKIARSIDVKN